VKGGKKPFQPHYKRIPNFPPSNHLGMKSYWLLYIVLSFFSVSSFSQSTISKSTYDEVMKLQDSVILFKGKLKLINVYKQQLRVLYQNREQPEPKLRAALIKETYTPFRSLWNDYVGDSTIYYEQVMIPLIKNKLEVLNQKGFDFATEDLDGYFQSTAATMKKLSGRNAKGVWYIAFGSGVTDLGGFGNGRMVLDLAHEKLKIDYVKLILPHEINHQIYDLSAPVDTTAKGLYRCINEGFAVYMNEKVLGDQHPLSSYLQYTDDELKFCMDNDSMIFYKLNRFLLTNDNDHALAFADRGTKIFRGAPGAIGYYIGYRICQSYVQLHGDKSWKAIYTMPVREVFNGSRYGKKVVTNK
jgi:hypothetical protein